jgi:hypothetical protein
LLPAWAGSPLAGRVSHPLDGTQSFMKASPPPIPFDQQSLVALIFLSPIGAWLTPLIGAGLALIASRYTVGFVS